MQDSRLVNRAAVEGLRSRLQTVWIMIRDWPLVYINYILKYFSLNLVGLSSMREREK